MENEWCFYNDFNNKGVGKVLDEGKKYLVIKYSDNQGYNPSGILKERVKRFNSLELAIDAYIENLSNKEMENLDQGPEEIKNQIMRDFSSYFKKKEKISS